MIGNCVTCTWCMQWMYNTCANIKNEEAGILEFASNNIVFFCNPCLAILPEALSMSKYFGQLEETLDTKLKTLYDKLHCQISKHPQVQFALTKLSELDSNCIKFQTYLNELTSKINELSSRNSKIYMEVDTASVFEQQCYIWIPIKYCTNYC